MSLDFIKEYVPDLSKEAEDHAYKTSSDIWYDAASKTSNPLVLDKLLDYHDPDVREEAARNLHCADRHLHKALNDEKWFVRKVAARNPKCNKEHLDKALSDEVEDVRLAAKRNPRYKEYYPNGHEQ